MDKKKVSQIEEFANFKSSIKLLGYDTEANKMGVLTTGKITGTNKYGGVRFRKGDATTVGEPFGDIDTIINMRTILQLGGYLVQNDHSRRKLDTSNHFKFASGGEAKLDGTMGHYQWGWGVPFYYAFWDDDEYDYEAYSTSPIPGRYNFRIPVASGSCGWATMDRTNNILVSYCNRNAQYRGGSNNASFDGAWNTQCGKPCVNIAFNVYQTAAEKNGVRWAANWFAFFFIVGALQRIYFHDRNIQKAWTTTLTENGLHQGGLGTGVDNVSGQFGSQYGTLDIDAMADLGDALGVFTKDVEKDDGTTLTIKNIPLFFGLPNWYHYLWAPLHGIRLQNLEDTSKDVYIKKVWNSEATDPSGLTGFTKIGTIPPSNQHWNYPKTMNFDHLALFPLSFGGSTSTYFADGFYSDSGTSGLRALAALGHASAGAEAGSGALSGSDAPATAAVHCGAFLCEAAEDWDTTAFFAA